MCKAGSKQGDKDCGATSCRTFPINPRSEYASLTQAGPGDLGDRSQLSVTATTCHHGTHRRRYCATTSVWTLTADRKAIHVLITFDSRVFPVLCIYAPGNDRSLGRTGGT